MSIPEKVNSRNSGTFRTLRSDEERIWVRWHELRRVLLTKRTTRADCQGDDTKAILMDPRGTPATFAD